MSNLAKQFLILLLVFVIIGGLLSTFNKEALSKKSRVTFDALINQIESGKVEKIEIRQNTLKVTLKDKTQLEVLRESNESLPTLLKNYGVLPSNLKAIKIEVKEPSGASFWISTILPLLIPFLIIGAFIYLMIKQVQGANSRAFMFGQARTREVKPDDQNKDRITFKDVAGCKEAKQELLEVVEFLKSPKKFTDLGAKVPKGVLLLGPPGVGKTLLARAVAGEAAVPFFHISGSEFVELFVGVGSARVRDAFAKAKKAAPSILFIDELDAIGRQRGAGIGGSHDEREQTLNQILVEMDGFEPNSGVILLSSTNRPDVLDPALLRPGRFDRRVVLDLPDINDREEILKVHSRGKPLTKDVNLRRVAERTPGFSGADLANLLNEAAILAARKDKKEIAMDEIIPSIEKVLLGPERKSHILSDQEKKITAYHEGGHALIAHTLPHADPVHKVSIIARGRAGGYTLKLPIEDKHLHSKAEFIDDLAVFMGGYAAEKLVFGDLTTGASNDLKQATKLARRLVTEFGMSDKLGPRTFGEKEELIFLGREISEQRDYSEKIAALIDSEVSKLLDSALKTAVQVITENRDKLEKLVTNLLRKETIEKEEFEKLMSGS